LWRYAAAIAAEKLLGHLLDSLQKATAEIERTLSRLFGACELDKPSKILIGGIVVGALTYGFGEFNLRRLERRVQELQRVCVAERDAEAKRQGPLSALTNLFRSGESQCDPVELARSNGQHEGIQGQLAVAEGEVLRWDSWHLIASMGVLVACSLPWLWYFFLRRVRELREAFFGK
jgi:hypothetical protein